MRKIGDRSQKPEARSQKRFGSERGVALILTLAILTLVTLLVIAFAVSMRVENMASKNFNDLIRARQLAQAAVDDAVATIRNATPTNPLPIINGAWVAIPGAIISNPTPAGVINTNILYTTPNPANAGTVDLNAGLLITGSNNFYNTLLPSGTANASITCGWFNVTAPSGELIGRFAYWTDVEATKIDINLAGMRTAPDPTTLTGVIDPLMNQSASSNIDLRALEDPFYENPALIGDPSAANTFVWAHSNPSASPARPWFTTIEEMQRGLPPPSPTYGSYTSNKFFVTVGTVDTNTDAFGRDRIDLQALNSTAAPAYTAALNSLSDAAWATFLYPGIITGPNTFAAKYGDFGIHQILANIIDYQRPFANLPTMSALDADGIPQLYCGLKKGPMIDEIIVHVATNAVPDSVDPINQTNLEVRVFVDVKLINGYEVPRGNGYVVQVALQGDPTIIYANAAAGSPTWTPSPTTTDQTRTLGGDIPAHGIRLLGSGTIPGTYPPPTYTTTINGVNPSTGPPTLSSLTLKLRHVRLLKSSNPNDIVDWMAQMDFDQSFLASGGEMQFSSATPLADFVPFDGPAGSATNSPDFTNGGGPFKPIGLFKQDIRTRTFPGYGVAPGPGQLANNVAVNLYTNWFVVASTGVNPTSPQQYLSRISPEVYSLLADLRSIEPGTLNSPQQHFLIDQISEVPITNVVELCYIHTGYPWRTLRFRSVVPETSAVASPYYDRQIPNPPYVGIGDPNTGLSAIEAHAIPDWILLDVFKVGKAGTFAGRININTKFSGPASALTPRVPPLQAVINNTSSNLSTYYLNNPATLPLNFGTNVDVIANNIANHAVFLGSPYDSVPAYLTPGQICEVSNLVYSSDDTLAGATYNDNPSKSRRQQLIRRISNLITTRSNTFTIWAIAQAIKEVGALDGLFNGQDFITGEVKVQAIVERYEDPPGTVKFRTRYYRYIYE